MGRTIVAIAVAGTLALATAGCRCESGMTGEEAQGSQSGQGEVTSNAPMKWCRACAMRGFTACKRVDGQESEETLRRKAELAACKDVGLDEAQCTGSVLSHVKCGTMEAVPPTQ